MSSVHENTIYSLKENVTGREDDGCRFRYVLSGEAISFFFDVEDEDIVSPYRKDNENIFLGDAVEVFLSPDGDLTRYKELEVSPFGCAFTAISATKAEVFPNSKKYRPPFLRTCACGRAAGARRLCCRSRRSRGSTEKR